MKPADSDLVAKALKACRRHVVTAAAFSLALNLLHLAAPLYMMQVYDRVIGSGSGATLLMLTLAVLSAYAALAGLDRARSSVMAAASLRLDRLLAGHAYAALVRDAAGGNSGQSQTLRDLDSCRHLATGPAVSALFDLPWIPIYAAVI
ncbi:MAG: type I secretion system permease/ATPase, partial [Hyphomicrobiaceae bacterium]